MYLICKEVNERDSPIIQETIEYIEINLDEIILESLPVCRDFQNTLKKSTKMTQ